VLSATSSDSEQHTVSAFITYFSNFLELVQDCGSIFDFKTFPACTITIAKVEAELKVGNQLFFL
jgi:hypothetical protein